jgi:hypothetical protein
MREVLIVEDPDDRSVTLSTSAMMPLLEVPHLDVGLSDVLDPVPDHSTQREYGTTRNAAEMALPVPHGHKLVHVVRHCRAWHK